MDVDNTSGLGPATQVPPEIQRWNWGAFLLNWIWGIGHNTLAALLVFVPVFGFFWMFVVGARGSEWAWRNKRWVSIEQFKASQRKWAVWGVVAWLAALGLAVVFFMGMLSLFKDSDAFKLAQATLEADERVMDILGRPVTTGFPSGAIQVSGPDGSANMAYSVEGPKGRGQVFVEARKELGQWKIKRMVFEEEGSGRRLDLSPASSEELPSGAT